MAWVTRKSFNNKGVSSQTTAKDNGGVVGFQTRANAPPPNAHALELGPAAFKTLRLPCPSIPLPPSHFLILKRRLLRRNQKSYKKSYKKKFIICNSPQIKPGAERWRWLIVAMVAMTKVCESAIADTRITVIVAVLMMVMVVMRMAMVMAMMATMMMVAANFW